jgi:hypothetical protein
MVLICNGIITSACHCPVDIDRAMLAAVPQRKLPQ